MKLWNWIYLNRVGLAQLTTIVILFFILFMLSLAADKQVRQTQETNQLIECVADFFETKRESRERAEVYLERCRENVE